MSSKAIYEGDGKRLLSKNLKNEHLVQPQYVHIDEDTDLDALVTANPWLNEKPLVVKPDQLVKRRGKLGLIKVNVDWDGAKSWLKERIGKEIQIEKTCGVLKNFIVEPFVPHQEKEEMYLCISTMRDADVIMFHHQGGVDVGDVDAKALSLKVPIGDSITIQTICSQLLCNVSDEDKSKLGSFIYNLFNTYVNLHFTYLEINPIVVKQDGIYVLDLAAKLDQAAEYICSKEWDNMRFPPPFGRRAYPEEEFIADLDAKSGASLKLTVLNPTGRIWTMVAGGGASVVYSDTIAQLGGSKEMANYGEYSGAPSESQTFQYAKTILSLMTKGDVNPEGKVLIIGGGIANFTNVSATFAGIVKALQMFQDELIKHNVKIFVRRGGPNYQEGLRIMRDLGRTLGVPMHVFGTETHMTAIVGMALGKTPIPEKSSVCDSNDMASMFLNPNDDGAGSISSSSKRKGSLSCSSSEEEVVKKMCCESNGVLTNGTNGSHTSTSQIFTKGSKAIVWGMQVRAVQGMLDFDYVCRRDQPSVKAIVYPFRYGEFCFYCGYSTPHH